MDDELFIKGLRINWNEISQDSYLRSIEALSQLKELEFHKPITFFVGENGSGKSTLLEAIAIAYGFNPEGGTKNYSFSTYDSHSELYDHLILIKGYRHSSWVYFLRAESFYNVASKEEEYGKLSPKGSMYYHYKSHGESFLAMAQDNFKGNGLYIFDEPEAALSPQRQLTLLYEIDRCVKEGSQFIIATHSPILLGIPNSEILSFDGSIHAIDYEDTDSYRITKMFINDKDRILTQLLNEE